MSVLQPIDLLNVSEGQKVSGLILVQSHTKKPEGTESKAPLSGIAHYKGRNMAFKVWDAQLQRLFNLNDLSGSILAVDASVSKYNDNLELTLNRINLDHGVTNPSLFYRSVNVEEVFAQFVEFVNTNLSPNALGILSHIFTSENLYEPFKYAWAASSMHDAQVGGLMNHTLKMLRLAKTLCENDPRLEQAKDLLYLSIIFHDIGKIREIGQGGTYTSISFVTHRILGVELLSRYRNMIIEAMGELFYYHLLAVVQQHHGEFGEPPTTIWSQIVHMIDHLEALTTGLMDKLEAKEYRVHNGHKAIWVNGTSLIV